MNYISYNSLHLLISLSISNSFGSALNNYTYSADGRKLKAEMKYGVNRANTKTTDYVGNMIYENGSLKRILPDGGYIENDKYYYYIQNHLGNNRVVAQADGSVLQVSHYYPFGMTFTENNMGDSRVQPYKYNGKEFDGERGLNVYDYSARYMDPALGRFMTVDPLAEKFYSVSPYVYCGNNPINLIDPDGKREWPINPTYKGHGRSHLNNYGAPRGKGRSHKGVDINHTSTDGNADKGAPIIATHDGKVTRVVRIGSGDKDAGGNRVQITSKDKRVSTSYMHLDAISSGIKVGTNISEGQQIGKMGGSGKGSSNEYVSHLHYEIKIDGVNINPVNGANHLVDPQIYLEPKATLPEVTVIAPRLAPKPIPMPEIKNIPEINRL